MPGKRGAKIAPMDSETVESSAGHWKTPSVRQVLFLLGFLLVLAIISLAMASYGRSIRVISGSGTGGITITSINGVPFNSSNSSQIKIGATSSGSKSPDWSWYPLSTDLSSFPKIDNPVFYKNVNGTVFYGDAVASKQIHGADSSSFQFAFDKNYSLGARGKDNTHVYWEDQALPSADPSTFTPMFDQNGTPSSYGEDMNNVYYADTLIQGVDRGSFVVLGSVYGKDKNNVYYQSSVLSGADIRTFLIVQEGCVNTAKDKFHVYTDGVILKNANPATFRGVAVFSCP